MTAQNNGSQTMVYAHVCAHACVCVSEVDVRYLPLQISLPAFTFETGLFWSLEHSDWLGKLAGEFRVLLSLFSHVRLTDVCHHTRLFTRVLGIRIQVLKFAQRGLDLLSHIPSYKTPQNEIFKKSTLNTVT